MALHVYGVTRASTVVPIHLRGVGDPPTPVRALLAGPLAAVVGRAPANQRARRQDVQAHQAVLLELAAVAPVLPSRFGEIVDDEASMRARLESDAGAYLAALDRVVDRVEMNLKIEIEEDGLADLGAEDEEIRRLAQENKRSPGYDVALRLGEAVFCGLRRRAASVSAELLPRLTELAEDFWQGPLVTDCVANWSFLIDADRVPRMRDVVGRCSAAAGSRAVIRLTGPLPCYNLAELSTAATAV